MNKFTSVSLSPLVVTVTSLPATQGRRTATSPFCFSSNTALLNADPLPASAGLSSNASALEATMAHTTDRAQATQYLTFIGISFADDFAGTPTGRAVRHVRKDALAPVDAGGNFPTRTSP